MLLGAATAEIYGTNDITDQFISSNSTTIVAGAGRCSQAAFFNGSAAAGPHMSFSPTDGGYYGWCGWAQRITDTSPGVLFGPTHTAGGYPGYGHIVLACSQAGELFLQRSYSGIVEQLTSTYTDPGTISFGQWYAFGMEWYVHPSTGFCRVYLNEELVINYSGNTTTKLYPVWTALYPVTKIQWQPHGYICDMYWGDMSGSAPWNAYMGDMRVEGQLPSSDLDRAGTYEEWTLSTGTNQGQLLDENPTNLTDYVESSTIGQRFSVRYPDIVLGSGTIYGVILMPNMAKTGSGTRTVATLIEHGGSFVEGTERAPSLGSSFYWPQVYQVNPVTAANWDVAGVNGSEAGMIVKS